MEKKIEIIDNKDDLRNYLFDKYNGLETLRQLIDNQENCASVSDYPVNAFEWHCCRDVWEEIEDEVKKNVDLRISYDDAIDVLMSIG